MSAAIAHKTGLPSTQTAADPVPTAADPAVAEPQDEGQEVWTEECNELLDQISVTQRTVASMLTSHQDNNKGLEVMKQQCDKELLELQEDAWRLQMLVELQKMGQQLDQLALPADEDCQAVSGDDSGNTASGVQQEAPHAQEGGEAAQDAAGGGAANPRQELADLDDEIAALEQELAAARIELQGLVHSKACLQDEVLAAGEELQPQPAAVVG